MTISQTGIDFIKSFESLRLEAYLCPAKKWTIGWGHTEGVHAGDSITVSAADGLLAGDLAVLDYDLWHAVTVPLTQGQLDALFSFAFNVGVEAFRISTLLKKLNAKAPPEEIAAEFPRWVHAMGETPGTWVTLPGLVRRREAERALFLTT